MGKKCKKNPRDSICFCCLDKIKEKHPRQIEKVSIDSKIIAHVYPEFLQEKYYLPKAICKTCKDNLDDESKCGMFPLVDYVRLVENVKQLHTNVDCKCELCRIFSVTIFNGVNTGKSPQKSDFLIKRKNNVGKIPSPKVPDVTDFFPKEKNQTLNDHLDQICESVTRGSLDQLCAKHLEKQVLYYTKPIKFQTNLVSVYFESLII